MRKYVFHIGSNDALATAEVGTVLGFKSILAVYKNFVLVESEQVLDQQFLDRMGSIIEIYEVYCELPFTDNQETIVDSIFEDLKEFELDSKVTYALSSNFLHNELKLQTLKKVKKNLKNSEHSSRFIENVTAASLKDAGTLNVNLHVYGVYNFKINLEKSVLLVGKLQAIQNIDKYALRDYSRPYRSAKLGMLPPKLSQIMINLATATGNELSTKSSKLVYDPFCGTGTVLMESLLMGHSAQGSDIQEVNIVGTNANIEWLASETGVNVAKVSRVFELDATKISPADLKDVDCIVTEGFLGVPKQGNEASPALLNELEELGVLYFDFLSAVAKAFKDLKRDLLTVVLTLPVYKGNGADEKKNFFIENLVEKLPTLGYSVSALVPDNSFGQKYKESVLYKRNDQKVLRQVYRLTLTSK